MSSPPTSADVGDDRETTDPENGEPPIADERVGEDPLLLGEDENADPLVVAERQRDEFLDALRRLQADFENYRKRVGRQQEEQADRVAISVVEKILPALDALDMALLHLDRLTETETETDERSETNGDAAGIAAREALTRVGTLLTGALANAGLERIDPLGESFDPNRHEAVAHMPATEERSGTTGATSDDDSGSETGPTVSEVLRAGYQWKGRVLRPAMVNVEG
jgi:molecular chaperone GrpE